MRWLPASRVVFSLACVACVVLLSACGSDGSGADVDASVAIDAAAADATDLACPRDPKPADRERFVIVSQPYDGDFNPSSDFAVLALSTTGELSSTGETFTLSRSFEGEIAFTADGSVGVVAHDDGSLGVFSIDESGAVTVAAAPFKYEFYASSVRASADGRRIYVLDSEFRNIGGGIYSMAVTCDGELIEEGLIAPAQLPQDLANLAGGGRALIPAGNILDSGDDFDLHLVDLTSATPQWIAGTDLFGAMDSIVSEIAVSSSGSLALVGDACGFCGPNSIAVAKMSGDSIVFAQKIDFNDPYDLVASPFDDRILALSGFGNAAFELAPSPGGEAPYAAPAELDYVGGSPQLPGSAVMVTRGDLEGLVLFPEVEGVRRVQFRPGESPQDLGLFTTPQTNPGAIGIQP